MRKYHAADRSKTGSHCNHDGTYSKESQPPFHYELYRVQMRQILNPGGIFPNQVLENDFCSTTNFRAEIEFKPSELPSESRSVPNGVNHWDLRNMYAAKGTVSGLVTANIVLSGLNHVEHHLLTGFNTKCFIRKWVRCLLF